METIRDNALAKARDALPGILALVQELQATCASGRTISEAYFLDKLREYNVYVSILEVCVHTQRSAEADVNGHHSSLRQALFAATPTPVVIPNAYLKSEGAVAEHVRHASLVSTIAPLLNAYVTWTLNLTDVVKAREKTKANLMS